MNSEALQSRRGSAIHPSHGIGIPLAPSLPIAAPRPLQRARDAASRLLGFPPSRPPSDHGGDRDEERFARGSAQFKRHPSLSISKDATVSHRTGLHINAVALNESGTHALIGGKGIFKTVKVEGGHCTEDLNLRTTILSTPKNASGAPRDIYQIDVADVAWAKRDFSNYIVAATSSGKIILYNLGIAGLQGTLLHEHSRQVHKVHFNPHFGNLLLSGSQDGTVRLWDLRAYRTPASTLHSKRKFSGQAGGVRDVKWSPTDGFDFAFGTDNGDIQRWDWRYPNVPKVKVSGHLLAAMLSIGILMASTLSVLALTK
jgi:WD40 repeat protein